ncbi:MAG: hypothetical protein K5695_10680 [Oscillospiraceae bacterium]|nr:hypothetical protein [Oscillospiraceae bacterium]
MNRKIAAGAAVLVLAASMAMAAPVSAAAETYAPIYGTTVTFDKYLVMDNTSNMPNTSFTFTVEPISRRIAANPKLDPPSLAVEKGPNGIKFAAGEGVTTTSSAPRRATATFSGDTAVTAEKDADPKKTIAFATPDNKTDEKFATVTLTLDLTGVKFTQPGIYRYKITEIPTEYAGITNDATLDRYLDVYVFDDLDENDNDILVLTGYGLHTGTDAPREGQKDDSKKSSGFTNRYDANSLRFEKKVTGNRGSRDKYFKFTVQLTDPDSLPLSDSDVITVSGDWDRHPEQHFGTAYTTEEMASNDVSQLTYGDLKNGYDFYLQDGQTIELSSIHKGLGYVLTEVQEDYTPAAALTGDRKTGDNSGEGELITAAVEAGETCIVSDTFLKTDTQIRITNDNSGDIPTGVITTVAGSAGIAVIGLAGIAAGVLFLKKKHGEDE